MTDETKPSVPSSSSAPQSEVKPSSPKSKFFSSKQLWSLAGLLLLVGVALAANEFVMKSSSPAVVDPSLTVVSFTPGLEANIDQKLTITFNYPVLAHDAQEFIELSPNVKGIWVQKDDKTIEFNPDFPYYQGSRFTVNLLLGLPSSAGKKLEANVQLDFGFRIAGDDIMFSKDDGYTYSLLSFAKQKGIDLEVRLGVEVKNPKVILYKLTNPQDILNAYIYPERGYYEWGKEAPKGVLSQIDTKKYTKVAEFTNLAKDNRIRRTNDSGLFYLEGFDGERFVRGGWVTVSDLGVLLRQDDQKLYLAGEKISTGEAINDMEVTLYNLAETSDVVTRGRVSGIGSFNIEYPRRVDMVMARKDAEIAFIPLMVPSGAAEIGVYYNLNDRNEIFIYTDRPIYRPGDEVKYRGLVRVDNDGLYLTPPTGTFIRIESGTGYKDIIKTNQGGVFEGSFKIPEDIKISNYNGPYYNPIYLSASTDLDEGYGYSYKSVGFEVTDYIKPEYAVEVNVNRNEMVEGDRVNIELKGEYFDGRPLANKQVKYNVYTLDYYETEKAVYNSAFRLNEWGGMCGGGDFFGDAYYGTEVETRNITLDSNGIARIDFDTKSLASTISQRITVVAQVTDQNGNELNDAEEVIVHGGEFNIFVRTNNRATYNPGSNVSAVFSAETLSGDKLRNQEFDYRLYSVTYGGGPDYKRNEHDIKRGKVKTDGNGYGILEEKAPASDNTLFMEVSGKDNKGNTVAGSSYIAVYNTDNSAYQTILGIVSSKNNFVAGETASVEINSPADINAFVTFERGRVYKPQWLNLKKGKNTFSFDVTDEMMPSITPTFSFFYNGEYHIEGLGLNVPAMKKLINMEVVADKQQYKPGEIAKLTITTKDSKNIPVPANVGVGIVDKAIYALQKNATPALHSSYYYFRARRTNASSSLSGVWMYGDGGKGGGGGGDGLSFDRDVDTLFWSPLLSTGTNGQVTIEVPVNNQETIWRMLGYSSTTDTKVGQVQFDFHVRK